MSDTTLDTASQPQEQTSVASSPLDLGDIIIVHLDEKIDEYIPAGLVTKDGSRLYQDSIGPVDEPMAPSDVPGYPCSK